MMDEQTRKTWEHMDTVWEHPAEIPFPEGAEIDLDDIGREEMDDYCMSRETAYDFDKYDDLRVI